MGFFDEWNSEDIKIWVNGQLKFQTTSRSNVSHNLKLCEYSTFLDRKLALSFRLDDYLENELLNITFLASKNTNKFGIYSIDAFIFDYCPNNSKFIGSSCKCNDGFYQDFTDIEISSCIRTSFNKEFCFRCTLCPPLCKKCHKDDINDFIVLCEECVDEIGVLKSQDGCRPKNSKNLKKY